MSIPSKNSNLLVMCGISCSGKSTTARKLQEAFGGVLVSTDMFRKQSCMNKVGLDRNPLERHVVYYNAIMKAEELLLQGRDVILDGTFILKILRQAAYYTAHATWSNVYLIHCVCNNYGLIKQRYERRKKNNNMFEAWQKIEGHNVKYQQFEALDREAMPDGRPVPIIRNDTETSKAEVLYSDGNRMMKRILEVLDQGQSTVSESADMLQSVSDGTC